MIFYAHAWMGFLSTRIDMCYCEEWRIIDYCSNTNVFHFVHNTNALREDHIRPSAYRFSHINCRS